MENQQIIETIQSPELLIPKKNIIMDSQMLSTLMSCPRLFDFRFNHNLVSNEGKSPSLEMGSIVHEVLENFYKNIIKGLKREQAINFAIVSGKEYIIKSGEIKNLTQEDIDLTFETLTQYFDYRINDSWTPLEVEVVKGKVLYEDDEIRIIWKAKFDLIADTNKGIYPIDHKTMKQRRDTLELNNQFMGQCILSGTRMMFVNKFGFQKTLKPQEKFERPAINYTPDLLDEWQNTILPYYTKMWLMYQESGYHPPNFTHCENKYGFCQFYKEVCKSDRGMRQDQLVRFFHPGDPWDISNE